MLMVDEIEGMAEVDFRHKLEELPAEDLARLAGDRKALAAVKPPLLSLSEAQAVLAQVLARPPAEPPAAPVANLDPAAEARKAARRDRDRARRARKKAEAAIAESASASEIAPPFEPEEIHHQDHQGHQEAVGAETPGPERPLGDLGVLGGSNDLAAGVDESIPTPAEPPHPDPLPPGAREMEEGVPAGDEECDPPRSLWARMKALWRRKGRP